MPPTHAPSRRRRSSSRLLAGPIAVIGLGVVAFALFAGLGGVSAASPKLVSSNPQTILAGENIFNAHCSACHGVSGTGSVRAPALINTGAANADFYLSTGRMPLNDPHDQALQHHPFFTPGQIRQLVSYIAALPRIDHVPSKQGSNIYTGPGIPSILPLCPASQDNSAAVIKSEKVGKNPSCVTLSYGQESFALNCSACHQISGAGGILSKGVLVPSLATATPLQVAEAIRIGPRPMPIFGPGQLSEAEMSAVVNYVEYLHAPRDPGGLSISGFGPTAEGFVAIVIGFVLLLIVSRLIGNRG